MADPTTVTGFWARWRASDLTSLADGAKVSSWAGSNALALTQGTAAAQPVVNTDANARRYVEFDGVDDQLFAAPGALLNAKGGATVYVVAHQLSTGTGVMYAVQITVGSSTNAARLMVGNNSGSVRAGGRRLDGDGFQSQTGQAQVTDKITVRTGHADWANSDLRIFLNGSLGGELLTFQTAGNTSATDSKQFGFGSQNGSNYHSMRAYEILVYEAPHTATERSTVHSYIQDTYGVTVSDYVSSTTNVSGADAFTFTELTSVSTFDDLAVLETYVVSDPSPTVLAMEDKSGTDTAASTDTSALTASPALSETHITSESVLNDAVVISSESSVVNDAVEKSENISISGLDSGTVAESQSSKASVGSTDDGLFTENPAVAEVTDYKEASDAVALTDAALLLETIGISAVDSLVLAESVGLSAAFVVSETSTVLQESSHQVQVNGVDSWAFVEASERAEQAILNLVDSFAAGESSLVDPTQFVSASDSAIHEAAVLITVILLARVDVSSFTDSASLVKELLPAAEYLHTRPPLSGIVAADALAGVVSNALAGGSPVVAEAFGVIVDYVTSALVSAHVGSGWPAPVASSGKPIDNVASGAYDSYVSSGIVQEVVLGGVVREVATDGFVESASADGLVTEVAATGIAADNVSEGLPGDHTNTGVTKAARTYGVEV